MSKKNHSEDLFELIKSLSKEERRYVKIFAKSIGGGSLKYIKLFDILEKQTDYDETEVKTKLYKQKINISQLANYKLYLYKFICKALANLSEKESIEEEILAGLRTVKALYRKRLYQQALRILAELEEWAREFDKFFYILRILDWQLVIHQSLSFSELSMQDFEVKKAAQLKAIAHVGLSLDYRMSLHQLSIQRKYYYSRDITDLSELDVLPPPPADAFSASLSYFQALTLKSSFLRDYPACINALNDSLNFIAAQPDWQKDADIHAVYVANLSSVLGFLSQTDQPDMFAINKARAEQLDMSRINPTQKAMLLQHQQLFFMHKKDFESAGRIAADLLVFLQTITEKDIMPIQLALLYFTIAAINIHLKNWDTAEQYLESSIRLKNSSSPQMYNSARLLYLLIYYEKGEFLMMPHSVRGLYRSLYKEQHLYPFERLFLRALRRLADCADEAETQKILAQLDKKWTKIMATATAIELEPLQYFDYLYWLKGRRLRKI
jgi:hypothetical protein